MERVHLSLTFSLVLSPFFFFFFFFRSRLVILAISLGHILFESTILGIMVVGSSSFFFFFLYYPLHVLLALPLELMYTLGGILDWL